MTTKPPQQVEREATDKFLCAGCGIPLDLNEYRSCDCPTSVAFVRGSQKSCVKKPRCAWCGAVPTAHNLDGENLCLPCCNKWARMEGFAAAERDEYDRTTNS